MCVRRSGPPPCFSSRTVSLNRGETWHRAGHTRNSPQADCPALPPGLSQHSRGRINPLFLEEFLLFWPYRLVLVHRLIIRREIMTKLYVTMNTFNVMFLIPLLKDWPTKETLSHDDMDNLYRSSKQ